MGEIVSDFNNPPFDWGNSNFSGTGSELTKELVAEKFSTSMANAADMYLIGKDGIESLLALAGTSINWTETGYDTTLLDTLMARVLNDLQAGATGLDPSIEADIFARELARQAIEDDKSYTAINEKFGPTGFDLPTGAFTSALQEMTNAKDMRTLDTNQKIAIDQAELAQRNSQFIIGVAEKLEATKADFHAKLNQRSLDYAKAIADTIMKIAESIAQLSMQAYASSIGAVNTAAHLSHSTGRQETESFGHSESRQYQFDHGKRISEDHNYTHDPA